MLPLALQALGARDDVDSIQCAAWAAQSHPPREAADILLASVERAPPPCAVPVLYVLDVLLPWLAPLVESRLFELLARMSATSDKTIKLLEAWARRSPAPFDPRHIQIALIRASSTAAPALRPLKSYTRRDWFPAELGAPRVLASQAFAPPPEIHEVPKDPRFAVCPLSGERFTTDWSDALQEWVYVDAVRPDAGGPIFSATAWKRQRFC